MQEILCENPYQEHARDKYKEPVRLRAVAKRPAMSHMSGSTAAQNLCEGCAESYDAKMATRQEENRKQRRKDVLRHSTQESIDKNS